jgi:hypothetical protein
MSDPQKPDETPDHPDDELPKLTAEEWAYIQAVVDAEKQGDD